MTTSVHSHRPSVESIVPWGMKATKSVNIVCRKLSPGKGPRTYKGLDHRLGATINSRSDQEAGAAVVSKRRKAIAPRDGGGVTCLGAFSTSFHQVMRASGASTSSPSCIQSTKQNDPGTAPRITALPRISRNPGNPGSPRAILQISSS